ncbi:DEAD/DEAH box helicase [Vibrio breoganii]|uniref:DEAD/DEAH box helicase n=1 Tax=Vibrio breoganii TaxID=553239 RepID=UPI000C82B1C1|nr:DEAD/DEAH box helicase [Vibrio breoganii]PMF94132.1 DEAD/DEAH box helicase [Vibrio breoganii]PMG03075.1 DEAD/DEAH box helicase [Vibrio breoganii]PMH12131.1 DEAD/DEAH box helicase [Vibrio breoganii]PML98797.1 DEAD/DEAH box helicase [Vibrio breoganii]PMM18143.1 DEAD/DEAH box helicase [Vibrio breoganii]
MPFSQLTLCSELSDTLQANFTTPTEVQSQAIPAILGRKDVLAIAQTGSGKTLAYGLAILEQVRLQPCSTQAIILVPTRELATQVCDTLEPYANTVDITALSLCGGIDKEWQKEQLLLTPEILVATPGRLLDLLKDQSIDVSRLSAFVLDEADRLLDMGFWPDIQEIVSLLPPKRQTLMFSATFSEKLETQAKGLLHSPKRIQTNVANSVVEGIEETLYLVNKGSKTNALIAQLKQHNWSQVLVFIGAKDNADALCKKLTKAGISVAALHGNKSQQEREETLELFKQRKVNVLIATDLLARGIHVQSLPVVINFELPSNAEVYVHRVGRTARAGEQGVAISLVCHGETEYLSAIRQLTLRELPLAELEGFPVTDKPSSGQSKRAPRDKKANRRTNSKKSVKQFQGKGKK